MTNPQSPLTKEPQQLPNQVDELQDPQPVQPLSPVVQQQAPLVDNKQTVLSKEDELLQALKVRDSAIKQFKKNKAIIQQIMQVEQQYKAIGEINNEDSQSKELIETEAEKELKELQVWIEGLPIEQTVEQTHKHDYETLDGLLGNEETKQALKTAVETISKLYRDFFANLPGSKEKIAALEKEVNNVREVFFEAVKRMLLGAEQTESQKALVIKNAFDNIIKTLQQLEVEKLRPAELMQKLTEAQQRKEKFQQAIDQLINKEDKSAEKANISSIIKNTVDYYPKLEDQVLVKRRLSDEFKLKLPKVDPNDKKKTDELLQKERISAKMGGINDIFEALLINNPEELKDLEPFKQYANDIDFEEKARKEFLEVGFPDSRTVHKRAIMTDIIEHLASLVRNKSATKKNIEAQASEVGSLKKNIEAQAGKVESLQNVTTIISVDQEDKEYDSADTAALTRAINGLAIVCSATGEKIDIDDESGVKANQEQKISAKKSGKERRADYIANYMPEDIAEKEISVIQTTLVESIRNELNNSFSKRIANASDEEKKNIIKEREDERARLEKVILEQHGIVAVKTKDDNKETGVYYCRNKDNKKAVYIFVGSNENVKYKVKVFREKTKAIIEHKKNFLEKDGKPAALLRFDLFGNYDAEDKEGAIRECLEKNVQIYFNEKKHPYSATLGEINTIKWDTGHNIIDAGTGITPAYDALMRLKGSGFREDGLGVHARWENRGQFLLLTSKNAEITNRLKADMIYVGNILSGTVAADLATKTAAKKTAKEMLKMFKKVPMYASDCTKLEAKLNPPKTLETAEDAARRDMKV